MKILKLICCMALVLSLCLSLTACTSDHTEAFIYFELTSVPATLDPQLVKTVDEITVARCLYDGLMRYDTQGNCVSSAAERYEKNGTTYTFYLKDTKWTNGEQLTAQDFVFAFRRAVDPVTKAPYAVTLSSIKNAVEIIQGSLPPTALGVKAVDEKTLTIELTEDDPGFLDTLTSPVTMPCNEKFFDSCKGKYGLTLDAVLCNGSYYVRVWNTEDSFLIRLAKNLDFKGTFEANSMRVYFTCSDLDNAEMVSSNKADAAFLDAQDYAAANDLGLSLVSDENTCYMLFLSENLSENFRKAFLQSVKTEGFTENFTNGYRSADSLFPAVLGVSDSGQTVPYDIASAAALYNAEVLSSPNKKPPELLLQYYDDTVAEATAKSIAAHWQQMIGAFINVEKISSLKQANTLFENGGYTMMILPFSSEYGNLAAYMTAFHTSANEPKTLQSELSTNYRCLPLFYANRYVCANASITNLAQTIKNGIPDMAFIIKLQ